MFSKKIKKQIKIENMHCSHCAQKIEEALKKIKEVKKVKSNVDAKEITIILSNNIDNEIIKNEIEKIGYKIENIKDI